MGDPYATAEVSALTADDYVAALAAIELHQRDRELLVTNYHAPDHTITATEMARALAFGSHGAANLHFGSLAKRVGDQVRIHPKHAALWVLITMSWPDGECAWTLRPQVAAALELLGWVRMPLTSLCVYTIKHSDNLRDTLNRGGHDTYTERKKWVRAKTLLDEAAREGKRLPIVFAPAQSTMRLFAWALLDEIVPDETSSYTFSDLRLFDPQPLKSTLRKASDGEPLDEGFIRPYAICRTPPDLASRPTKNVATMPGEIEGTGLVEGAVYRVSVSAYERNPEARRRCIAAHGAKCCICEFDFGKAYGSVVDGFIHVHHLAPLSQAGGEHEVDPVADLRPVCPNCHAVLHSHVPAYSIEEVRAFLKHQRPRP